jgi:hypothetical protein
MSFDDGGPRDGIRSRRPHLQAAAGELIFKLVNTAGPALIVDELRIALAAADRIFKLQVGHLQQQMGL